MPRSRRKATNKTQSHTPAAQNGSQQGGPGNEAAKGGRGGGIMGWFRDTGAWMGDQINGATEAVGEWASNTAEFARDTVEAVTSTSVGMEGGAIYIEVDLDELSDLMSADTRAALGLDRATSDNRVRISYSRDTGEVVATSDQIALAGVDTPKVKAGQVLLNGVRAVFTNHGGGVPGLDENFSLLGFKDSADNLQAVVTIASARAVDVEFQGPDGPTSVASVDLQGIAGTVGAQGGMPFAQAGTTEVDFALEHAVLEGLNAGGHTVASAQVSDVTAGMSGSSESAFLAAESVAVSGVGGDSSAGSAEVSGLRVDVDNRGGGLLGADKTADQARARVAVEAASVSDLDTDKFDATSLSASGFSGQFDTVTGAGSASIQQLGTAGLDTSWVDANRLAASDVTLGGYRSNEDGRAAASLTVGNLTGDGLSVDPVTDGQSAAAAGGQAIDWSAQLGTADLTNSSLGNTTVGRTQLTDANLNGAVDGDQSTVSATVGKATLTDLAQDAFSAQTLSTTNTSMSANAGSFSANADQVTGRDVRTKNLRAAELSAYGGSTTVSGDSATASLDRARLSDATLNDRVDIQSAELDRLDGSRTGNAASIQLGSGALSGVSDRGTGAQFETGSINNATVKLNGDANTASASVGSASIQNASGLGGTLQSASVSNVSASRGGGTANLSAANASVSGLTHANGSLQNASISDITASKSGGTQTLAADSLSVDGLAHGNHAVASASGRRLTATRDGDGVRAGLGTLAADQIQVGDSTSIDKAWAHGVAVAQSESGGQASVTNAYLEGARFDNGTARGSVDSAKIKGAALSSDGQSVNGGAESLQLSNLSAGGTNSAERRAARSGGSSSVDTARLIETGAAQIQDAQVSASANIQPGDLGVAGLKARPGTTASLGLSVRDGRIADEGTGVNLSQRLKGPLWTSVDGAYMENGQLKAGVRGWKDQDVTSTVNDALGVSGDRIPDLATIGKGAADQMRSSSSSSSSSDTGLGGIIDMNSARVEASAQLGDGVIDGGAFRTDLATAEQQGDNALDISARDGSLDAAIQRFLADSAAYSNNGVHASSGRTEASGVDLSTNESNWSLQVDEFNANDLRGGRR